MYQICFANMLQIHISDTIMYTLAEMNVSNMYYVFDTKLTFLVVYNRSCYSIVVSLTLFETCIFIAQVNKKHSL